jgi:hypothetical protein
MSRKILLLVLVIISAGLVKGVHLLWTGNKRLQESTEAFDQRLASLEKLAARFESVEEEVRKLGASPAAPTGRSGAEGPEAATASEGATRTPEDRLASLETEMGELAERLEGLADDPISRGYSFLGSEFPDLRREGIGLLKPLARSDPEARAAIRKLLRDPNPRVREKAADTLKDVRDRESLTDILPLLTDADARTRRRAVQAMGTLGAKDAVQAVAQHLASDQDDGVRLAAARSLRALKGAEAAEVLVKALRDPNEAVRGEAVAALGEVGAKSAAPQLRAFYDQDPGRYRVRLAVALKALGDEAPFQSEVQRLSEMARSDPDERVRRQALVDLAGFARQPARPVFTQALEDPSPLVRREAERALR